MGFFSVTQDALTLQRVCLEKKTELTEDDSNDVPDVKAAVQELMTSLFIATYNHTVCFIFSTKSSRPN